VELGDSVVGLAEKSDSRFGNEYSPLDPTNTLHQVG